MRDHLDIDGHDEAVKAIEDAVRRDEAITEVFIRNLHKPQSTERMNVAAC